MAKQPITLAEALIALNDKELLEKTLREMNVMQLMALKLDADAHIKHEPKLLRLMGDFHNKFKFRIPQQTVLSVLGEFSRLSQELIIERSRK